MPVAAEWADTLREGIRAFSRSRRVGSPAVQVTLADGESFFLMRAEPGPGDDWISLYPYPAGRLDEMIHDADAKGELTTPRVVIIHPEMVAPDGDSGLQGQKLNRSVAGCRLKLFTGRASVRCSPPD